MLYVIKEKIKTSFIVTAKNVTADLSKSAILYETKKKIDRVVY